MLFFVATSSYNSYCNDVPSSLNTFLGIITSPTLTFLENPPHIPIKVISLTSNAIKVSTVSAIAGEPYPPWTKHTF